MVSVCCRLIELYCFSNLQAFFTWKCDCTRCVILRQTEACESRQRIQKDAPTSLRFTPRPNSSGIFQVEESQFQRRCQTKCFFFLLTSQIKRKKTLCLSHSGGHLQNDFENVTVLQQLIRSLWSNTIKRKNRSVKSSVSGSRVFVEFFYKH